jgi:S1-C subfamily serine protease
MATKGSAVLAILFVLCLSTLLLRDFSREVDGLRSRLEASDAQLRQARADVRSLRRESEASWERVADGVARTQAEFREARSRLEARDVEALYRDVLAPSVQVNGKGGVGGGTLLYSREDHSYVVTAFHVIQKVVTRDAEGEKREPVTVQVYDDRGAPADVVPSDLLAYDEKKDLALLRLRSPKAFPRVARLASRETLRRIKVFTPVYALGCPLGHDPLPTLGEVATLNKEVGGEKFWMMNAPTIFGNSGGGIFHRESRELIGVSVMICTYDGAVSTPVPHLGILVSLESVYDWLDSLHYRFVYDPQASIEACERTREPAPPAPRGGARPTGFAEGRP